MALEQPQLFHVQLNGSPFSTEGACGWWVDKSLIKLPPDPSHLSMGHNEITLRGRYDENRGLEIIYLLGNFGIKVTRLPKQPPIPTNCQANSLY